MSARPRRSRRGERGVMLVEVMVAGAVLLVAMLGFLATSRYAATATAVGHRRTMTTLLRAEVMDRLSVLPRAALRPLTDQTGTSATLTYVVDTCYDVNGRALKRNAAFAATTDAYCGANTVYRSFVGARAELNGRWTVGTYVERVDQGCTAATRNQTTGCSAADLLLTD